MQTNVYSSTFFALFGVLDRIVVGHCYESTDFLKAIAVTR